MPSDFFAKLWAYLSRPFSSSEEFISSISGTIDAVAAIESKTGWLYLLSSLCTAWLIYRMAKRSGAAEAQGSFTGYLFPRRIYAHRSAIADYKYVAVDLTIRGVVYLPIVSGVSQLVYNLLKPFSFGIALPWLADTHLRAALLTLLNALFTDFGFFLAHYLMHRISWLWPFHEVHHSAEVLTPVTVYRVHPVEDLVTSVTGGVISALTAKTLALLSGTGVSEMTLLGLNVFNFFFFLAAFQLRHSHVWLSYGPRLSKILISPAQHHIHHSVDSRHWNRNFGFTFAFWDLLFGSLYIPREREQIRFGVPGCAAEDFSSVGRIYLLPFVKSWRLLSRHLRLKRRIAPVDAA